MNELAARAAPSAALLKAKGWTVAVAESSAGGLISAALLAVPGASVFYLGGGVIYTRTVRRGLLGITDDAVKAAGGSTAAYAGLLAETIRAKLGATWAIGETGAAGPTGTRYGHPPGYCCIAVGGPVQRAITIESGVSDRETNMWRFTEAALDLFHQALTVAG
jgi:PncC family amidohydrolase